MKQRILLLLSGILLHLQLSAQLNGVYTIGGVAPDYATFSAAASALSLQGISGTVTFNVRSGTYPEKLILGTITGTSSNNVVIFQSEDGDSSGVILTDSATSTTGNNFTLQLNGASHIFFRQLTIQRTGAGTYSTVISIDQSAVGNQFLNNRIVGLTATSSTLNNVLIHSPSGSTGLDSNCVFINNLFENGSYGLYFYGESATAREGGTVISRNKFLNQYARGIYMSFQSAPQIHENLITTNSAFATWYGVYIASSEKGIEVIKNNITHPNSSGDGIYLTNCTGNTGGGEIKIYNNFIAMTGSGTAYGLYLTGVDNINVYYNSVNLTSTGTTTRGLYLTGTDSNVHVLNNVLVNAGGGYAIYVAAAALPGLVISDNNDLYTSGASVGYWNTAAVATLTDWQTTTSHDLHSVSVDPVFYSSTDLHASGSGINNAGTPIPGINTDIDGETRSASTPDIGADEFLPLADNVGVIALVAPAPGICGDSSTQVGIVLKNFGSNTQTNIPVGAILTGAVSQTLNDTYTGSLSTNTTDTFYFSQTVVTIAGGTIDIAAYTALPGDQYLVNDTNHVSLNINPVPDQPIVVSPQQQCDNNVAIYATPDTTQVLFWYDQPAGGTLLYAGNPFTPVVSTDTTFYVEARNAGGCLRITECGIGGANDFLEIQNLSNSFVDATGWTAVISNSYTNINLVNANVWNLGTFAPGEIQYKTDNTSENYWGSNMLWNPGSESWAMIIDNGGYVVDFVAWDWTDSVIQTLNITVNGFPVSVGSQWIGDGTLACATPNSVSRTGSTETNTIADWTCEPETKGIQNANLTASFSNCSVGTCASTRIPVEINLVPGITTNLGNDTILAIPFSYVIDAGTGFTSYLWSTGETTQTITVTTGDVYWCTVTGGPNNCSYTDTILVNFTVGLPQDERSDLYQVHPNPSNGIVTISGFLSEDKAGEIRLMDLEGRLVTQRNFTTGTKSESFEVSGMANGVYVIEINAGNARYTRKLVVQHD